MALVSWVCNNSSYLPGQTVSTDGLSEGSHIAREIITTNSPTRIVQVASRRPERVHRSLYDSLRPAAQSRLLPPKAVDITDQSTLAPAFQDADVVVSLVGIMHGTPADFERIQWRGAENVARAARAVGAKLIHISAIGADSQSELPYERTKALGEEAVFRTCADATIIRPSIVFGPEDDFFNVCNVVQLLFDRACLYEVQRFAKLSRVLPFMPVFAGGQALFQPVYVGDIARLVELLSRGDPNINSNMKGKIIEAGGPDGLSLTQIVLVFILKPYQTV